MRNREIRHHLMEECKRHIKLKKYEEALECLDKGIEINPQLSSYWFEKGFIYEIYLNKKNAALVAYTQAAQIKPNNKRYLLRKALVLRSLKRHKEALICFEYLMEMKSEHNTICYSNVLFYIAESLEYMERIDEAAIFNKKAWEMVSKQC